MGGIVDMEGTYVGYGGGMPGWYMVRCWMGKGGAVGWNCWPCCCMRSRRVMAPWRPAALGRIVLCIAFLLQPPVVRVAW